MKDGDSGPARQRPPRDRAADPRTLRLQELQARIREGTYLPDPERLAWAMLRAAELHAPAAQGLH